MECYHNMVLGYQTFTNGTKHFLRMCSLCYHKEPIDENGNVWIKKDSLSEEEKDAAVSLDQLIQTGNDKKNEIKRKNAEALKQRNDEWYKEYDEYLQTPGWRVVRQAVLGRDKGKCQECLHYGIIKKATQIHHMTYKNLHSERLYELVSLCDECHGRMPHR